MATVANDISLGRFNTGSVYRFKPTIYKDGVVWDLSSGSPTVTLTLRAPSGAEQSHAMTALNTGSDGIFYYDTTTADLTEIGYWTATVHVVQGTIDEIFPCEISFTVADRPERLV